MDIRVLLKKKADLTKRAGEIIDSVGADGMTAEQQAEYDKIKADLEKTNNQIVLCQEQMAREKEIEAMPALSQSHRVSVTHENIDDDPKGGFKGHKDFLNAVMQAGYRGAEDQRLRRYKAVQGSDEAQVGSDPYGGYLVPVGIAPGVLTVRPEADPISALVNNVPMNAPTVAFNARVDKNHSTSVSGGLTVTRKPETVDATSERMRFEQIRLTANDLFGLAYATENILTDSPESFVAILTAGFSDEFGSNMTYERLNGTGVGEFLGILNANCKCTIQVAKEGSQGADTILKENIDKMIARCWRYSEAVWHANHSTRPQLAGMYQLVGTTGGAPVVYFQPGAGPGGVDLLVGRPIYFTEHCAALGDRGDIVLAQWSQYLEGTYQRMQQAESIHVRFVAHERTFKFWLRNDGKPWWTSALTPKNGDTLSPFVTLAAR